MTIAIPVLTTDADRAPSIAQFRAARALLDWSQDEFAAKAAVGRATVGDFERGARTPMRQNLLAMRRTLEQAGIAFLWSPDGGEGVVRAGSGTADQPASG
jgi:transcriptional regulator with XRE-family HTH domain